MAEGVGWVRVLLRPTTIAIKGHANMAWGLGEVEILDYPPLIEWVEQRLNLTTNTSEQFSARR
jgi:hypothetical protein